MSTISFSGLGSGLDTASWVEALVEVEQSKIDKVQTKRNTTNTSYNGLKTLQSTYTNFQTSIEKFTDARFGTSFNLFAKNTASSSNTDAVTATVTSYASRQALNVTVQNLATSTKAESQTASGNVGSVIDGDTVFGKLSSGSAKTGTFSLFVDNRQYNINVGEEDTLESIAEQINQIEGVNASISDGKFAITADESHTLNAGSTLDTSNFFNIMAMEKDGSGNYQSSRKISEANTQVALTSVNAGFAEQIQTGSFKIGNDTFTIDDTTSLQGLINKINSSEEAGVNAYWDATADKLVLTAKNEGSFNINIEDIEGNFTQVMGLTEQTGGVSKIKEGSQTLGNVANFTINGTAMTSTSNTVGSDVTGITGLTLNLNAVTESGKSATVTVVQDTEAVLEAAKSFVENINKVLAQTDEATDTTGVLNGETSLNSIRNQIRTITSSSYSGNDMYRTLASIGISTGTPGQTLDFDTDKFYIDEEKFLAALKTNPDEVQQLFIGDGVAGGNAGIMKRLETVVDNSLDPTSGYFAARGTSFTKQIESYDDTIEKMNDSLEAYRARLEAQFQVMDEMISKLNNQYSSFTSAMKSISS